MTAQELIDKLKEYPSDAVIHQRIKDDFISSIVGITYSKATKEHIWSEYSETQKVSMILLYWRYINGIPSRKNR